MLDVAALLRPFTVLRLYYSAPPDSDTCWRAIPTSFIHVGFILLTLRSKMLAVWKRTNSKPLSAVAEQSFKCNSSESCLATALKRFLYPSTEACGQVTGGVQTGSLVISSSSALALNQLWLANLGTVCGIIIASHCNLTALMGHKGGHPKKADIWALGPCLWPYSWLFLINLSENIQCAKHYLDTQIFSSCHCHQYYYHYYYHYHYHLNRVRVRKPLLCQVCWSKNANMSIDWGQRKGPGQINK